MEYIANRLGLVFMKINGPALGHKVTSLDPMEAPNATARQEIEKLNLALEMGNNVMLYIDDIQHTNPEFLQKFVSQLAIVTGKRFAASNFSSGVTALSSISFNLFRLSAYSIEFTSPSNF